MGLNFYGYDFVRPDDDAGQSKKSKAKKKQAAAAAAQASPMMGDAFLAALRKYKPKLVWEEEHAEHRIRFKDTATGTRHTAYFPTPAALAARVQLAQRLGAGLSLWELGQGMDCFLDLL
jgi:chitinase domain-containing protein 1